MAEITPINRSTPNDGQGFNLYVGAGVINQNFENLNNDKSEIQVEITNLLLEATEWSFNTPYWEYDLAHPLIDADIAVDIIPDDADIDEVKSAEILPRTVSSSGSVRIRALNEPLTDIGVTLILRQSILYTTTTTTV